jgi:hypothetical protein
MKQFITVNVFNGCCEADQPSQIIFGIGPVKPQNAEVGIPTFTADEQPKGPTMLSLTVGAGSKYALFVAAYLDAKGNPTQPPANAKVEWSLDIPGVVDGVVTDDGKLIIEGNALGNVAITATVKSDGADLVGTAAITVIAGPAAQVVLDAEPVAEVAPKPLVFKKG